MGAILTGHLPNPLAASTVASMAFCQSCGSPLDGKFCRKCRAPAGQRARSTTGRPPRMSPASGSSGLSDSAAGALCDIPIVAVIFLVVVPYKRNKLIRFHAFQRLFLLAAVIVINIGITAVF